MKWTTVRKKKSDEWWGRGLGERTINWFFNRGLTKETILSGKRSGMEETG